ncbi:MAG: hypothetical protein D6811_08040 [Alphaproteobacteria bacterium]|nr:MAG: hypothetical protein D6811_08040 [Alphaproteobacteria bacterium]
MSIETDDCPWIIPASSVGAPARRTRRAVARLAEIFGALPRLSVRETGRGYVIEQPLTLVPVSARDRRALIGAGAVALAMATAGWTGMELMAPAAGWGGAALVGLQAGIAGLAVTLLHGMRGSLRVEVDTFARRIRVWRVGRRRACRLAERPFGSGSELVLQRARGGLMRLCLRTGEAERPRWQVIALGEEAELRDLHRRIARDLAPLQERVASARGRARTSRRQMAFPGLGPHELIAG